MALPVALGSPRALPEPALRAALARHGVPTAPVHTVSGALAWFRARAYPDDGLLVTGSHVTVAAVLAAE